MYFLVYLIPCVGLSFVTRCFVVRVLPHDVRRNELTLPLKLSWQSSDSVEKAGRSYFVHRYKWTESVRVMWLPLSVGEPSVRLLRLELKLYGFGDGGTAAFSSRGKHVSTIASKQLTNSSDDSPMRLYWKGRLKQINCSLDWETERKLTLGLVNGPAKRQSPPKPQLCRKWSCCWDGSSVASMFWIILWMAISTAWSFEMDSTLLIFWSSSECLQGNGWTCYFTLVKWTLSRLTWRETLLEKRRSLLPNTGIAHASRSHRSCIWRVSRGLWGQVPALRDLISLLDREEHSIRSTRTTSIPVPTFRGNGINRIEMQNVDERTNFFSNKFIDTVHLMSSNGRMIGACGTLICKSVEIAFR